MGAMPNCSYCKPSPAESTATLMWRSHITRDKQAFTVLSGFQMPQCSRPMHQRVMPNSRLVPWDDNNNRQACGQATSRRCPTTSRTFSHHDNPTEEVLQARPHSTCQASQPTCHACNIRMAANVAHQYPQHACLHQQTT